MASQSSRIEGFHANASCRHEAFEHDEGLRAGSASATRHSQAPTSHRTTPAAYWPITLCVAAVVWSIERSERSTFTFSSRTSVALKCAAVHRHQSQQLEHVALDHVTSGATGDDAATLEPHRFGHGDLNVIDPLAFPQQLEQPIAEAKREQVLHRLLAEIMIDAERTLLGLRRRRR